MEADWEVELGPGAPVIEAQWAGFVDLRVNPELVGTIPEAAVLDGLAEALVQLNGRDSPVWTSKCDVWPLLDAADWDADELDAPLENAACAWACYLDLLPRRDRQWAEPEMAVREGRTICGRLRSAELSCCRVDLVVRQAEIAQEQSTMGITAYLTACGADSSQAKQALSGALVRFADALLPRSTVE